MRTKRYNRSKCDDFVCEHCFDGSCPRDNDLVRSCSECWFNLDDCELCHNEECPANAYYEGGLEGDDE